MGLYMNKIFRFCAADMLAVAFYGCDTSDSSKPVAPEEEKAQIDDQSEPKDNPETESKDDTWHHLHIFYADRHANGSVLHLNF